MTPLQSTCLQYVYVVPPMGASKSQLGGTYCVPLLLFTVNVYCDHINICIHFHCLSFFLCVGVFVRMIHSTSEFAMTVHKVVVWKIAADKVVCERLYAKELCVRVKDWGCKKLVCVCVTKLCVYEKDCIWQSCLIGCVCVCVSVWQGCIWKIVRDKVARERPCVTQLCVCVCEGLCLTKLSVKRLCVTPLCVKGYVWQSCVGKIVLCEKTVSHKETEEEDKKEMKRTSGRSRWSGRDTEPKTRTSWHNDVRKIISDQWSLAFMADIITIPVASILCVWPVVPQSTFPCLGSIQWCNCLSTSNFSIVFWCLLIASDLNVLRDQFVGWWSCTCFLHTVCELSSPWNWKMPGPANQRRSDFPISAKRARAWQSLVRFLAVSCSMTTSPFCSKKHARNRQLWQPALRLRPHGRSRPGENIAARIWRTMAWPFQCTSYAH